MNLFRTKTLDIDVREPGVLLFSVYKHTLANRINLLLKQYNGERIRKGEEPMFKVNAKEWAKIKDSLYLPSHTIDKIENFYKKSH